MVEIIIAKGSDIKKLVTTSINCLACNITGGILMRARYSRVLFNFSQFSNKQYTKIIIEMAKISGNGTIFYKSSSGNFIGKLNITGKYRLELPFSETIELSRDAMSIGEISILSVSMYIDGGGLINKENMSNRTRSNRDLRTSSSEYINKAKAISRDPEDRYILFINNDCGFDYFERLFNSLEDYGINGIICTDYISNDTKNIINGCQYIFSNNIKANEYFKSIGFGNKVVDITNFTNYLNNELYDFILQTLNVDKSKKVARKIIGNLSKAIQENKYKVSIVMSLKNRTNFLRFTLETLIRQTMPKDDWELVVVDDGSTEDICKFLESYSDRINIKYLKIDNKKSEIPIWSHTPSLSNNVGFKNAEGEVIVICGPEILHKETNLEFAYKAACKNISAFGLVWHSNLNFVNKVFSHFDPKNTSFDNYIATEGAKHNCITQNTFYWYLLAVKRSHILNIGGVDEEYGRGVCGEDDNFAARLHVSGITNTHAFDMVAIHMEHESGDDRYDQRRHRETAAWKEARRINTERWNLWHINKKISANDGMDWGSNKVIDVYKSMTNGLLFDYNKFNVTTTYNLQSIKVLYLSLGYQPGMEDAFRKFGVDLFVYNFWDKFAVDKQNAKSINNELIEIVKKFKPNLIHMQLQFTGIITTNTISEIKRINPKIIITNWTGDVRATVPGYFTNIGKVIDYTLICNTGQIQNLIQANCKNPTYWQMGIDTNTNHPLYKKDFKYDCVFIGNCYKDFPGYKARTEFCKALKNRYGARCGIFGTGWDNISNGPVTWKDANDVYNSSKVVISISNFNNIADYFSDRLLMAMASGRPVLSWSFPNIGAYLVDGVNGYYTSSVEDGIAKMHNILKQSTEELNIVGTNGAKAVLENHTFVSRVYDLFKLTGILK